MDKQDPTESTEQAEPTDPIDNTDPLEPIDNMDLSDQRLRKESVEPIDHLLLLLTCLSLPPGYSMQETHPSTSVPSRATWRSRM